MNLTLPGYRTHKAPSRAEKWAAWAKTHWTQLALGGSVVAVILLLGIAIAASRARLRERTSEVLSTARYQAGTGKKKDAIATLDGVLKSDRTSPGALQAYSMKGELLYSEGQFAEAEAVYREAITQSNHPQYRPLFLMGQASCAVALQKSGEAADALSLFLKEFPDHFLAPRAHMELGRVRYSEQKWSDAQAAFEKVVTLYPKSSWAPEAQAFLAEIKTHLPAAVPESVPAAK